MIIAENQLIACNVNDKRISISDLEAVSTHKSFWLIDTTTSIGEITLIDKLFVQNSFVLHA